MIMRKLNKFALMGAIALTGTAGFTACSSDDVLGENGPSISSGETVKTQFAINIPHAQGTRMSDAITQADNTTFRGMDNIRLIPFDLETTPSSASKPLQGTEDLRYNAIILPQIAENDGLATGTNSKVYNDVDIAIGVDAFLFYGEAITDTESGLDEEQANGVLNPSYATSGLNSGALLSTISFDLQSILGTQDVTASQNALVTLLNAVAGTTGTNSKKWSEVTEQENAALHEYYQSLIGLKAGSANSIRLALQDLYNAMGSPRVSDTEGLKAAIQSAILGPSNANFTVNGTAPNATLTYAESFAGKDYPTAFNLPDGAGQIDWDTNTFKYIDNADNTGLNVGALSSYVYPASLYYWTNSSIKTATTPQGDNYTGKTSWNDVLSDLYTNTREVEANTQSVALEQTINYAVGRLDIYAQFENGQISDAKDEEVTFPATGFQLTGVLIGGQKNVGWNFQPTGTTEYTIYDAAVKTGTYITRTKPGTPNTRTLVLETEGVATDPFETKYIALEFVNNSNEAFQGVDGIVPVGGKFYLVGEITSNTAHPKVFQQDYYTTANVKISSLKKAYNCIPDLRTPQLELGLSVDLTWQQGLTDDVVIE